MLGKRSLSRIHVHKNKAPTLNPIWKGFQGVSIVWTLIRTLPRRHLCLFHLHWVRQTFLFCLQQLDNSRCSPQKLLCQICWPYREGGGPEGSFRLSAAREVEARAKALSYLGAFTFRNEQALCMVQLCQTPVTHTLRDSICTLCAPGGLEVRKPKGLWQNCTENLYW